MPGRKSTVIDLTGQRFHRWTVLSRAVENKDQKPAWVCRCDCGTIREVLGRSLRLGRSRSCDCLKNEEIGDRRRIHGATGNHEEDRLYNVWKHVKWRCLNPNCEHYKNYGGRGITICAEWLDDYAAFRDWGLANGYEEHLTIERKDVNGNYEPSNCTWIPNAMQARNTRRTQPVVRSDGVAFRSTVEAAEASGCQPSHIYQVRIGKMKTAGGYGWSLPGE